MKKKILLPTDFSKNSWTAIAYASELYKNDKVDFYILNAFQTDSIFSNFIIPAPGDISYENAKEKSYSGLERLLVKIKANRQYKNHQYYTVSSYNTTVEAVKNFIEDKDIEMVIISNKGETNDLDTVIGGNTVNMMEKIRNCPVLVVPSNITFKKPNEIVFPTSFKTHYKKRELNYLYEIYKITDSPIRILHIGEEDQLSKEQTDKKLLLEECLNGIEYSFHYLQNTNINEALRLFVQSRDSEMITFINKKHAFFDSVFTKPMVKDLGYTSNVPILTLHDWKN